MPPSPRPGRTHLSARLQETALRRALLACAQDPGRGEDLRECAVLLADSGRDRAAALVAAVAGLLPGEACPAPDGRGFACTWDLAVADLGGLIATADRAGPLPSAGQLLAEAPGPRPARGADGGPGGGPGRVEEGARAPDMAWVEAEFPVVCFELVHLLGEAATPQTLGRLRALVEVLGRETTGRRRLELRHAEFDDPARLATGLAFNAFHEVMSARQHLARAPFGSAELFHAAARLAPEGLGPGLSGAARTVLDPQELFALIRQAWRLAGAPGAFLDVLDRFSVLLSAGLDRLALFELVQALADAGRTRALAGILVHISSSVGAEGDRLLLRTIRDAGLDLGASDLALAAQRRLAELWPEDGLEEVALGDLEGAWGDPAAARLIFANLLERSPAAVSVEQRLELLGTPAFEAVRPVGGFTTPAPRRRRRYVHRLQASGG